MQSFIRGTPQYRVEFFERLVLAAGEAGIDLRIFHGDPPPEWADRGDSVVSPVATRLPTRFLRAGSRSLAIKSLTEFDAAGPYDLVVLEQAIRNLETYRIMLSRHRHRIAWWGHGRTYTAPKPSSEEVAKRVVTNRGRWFFAYTKGGAAAVEAGGFPRDRVTVVNNSTDTRGIRLALDNLPAETVADLRAAHGLTEHTAMFIGGLDESKRIPFLLDAARRIHAQLPTFRLIVIGDGEYRDDLRRFTESNPWCVWLGKLFGDERAAAFEASSLLLMPGRVGLAAVDSFAARVPIVTTDWPFHAPEFEYLESGRNALVTPDSAIAFANATAGLLVDAPRLERLRSGCVTSELDYGVEAMVSRFLDGLQEAVGATSRRSRRRNGSKYGA